jgi:hypothetical protein
MLSLAMFDKNHSKIWTNASLLGAGAVIIGTLPYHFLRGPTKFIAPLGLLFVLACAKFWQSQVTKIVPEPYLVSSPFLGDYGLSLIRRKGRSLPHSTGASVL